MAYGSYLISMVVIFIVLSLNASTNELEAGLYIGRIIS